MARIPAILRGKPLRRAAGAALVAPVLAISLYAAAGGDTSPLFSTLAGERVGGSCSGLDVSNLDPANPAHRPCYCAVDARDDVCRSPLAPR